MIKLIFLSSMIALAFFVNDLLCWRDEFVDEVAAEVQLLNGKISFLEKELSEVKQHEQH